jgi:hypothetical protein
MRAFATPTITDPSKATLGSGSDQVLGANRAGGQRTADNVAIIARQDDDLASFDRDGGLPFDLQQHTSDSDVVVRDDL